MKNYALIAIGSAVLAGAIGLSAGAVIPDAKGVVQQTITNDSAKIKPTTSDDINMLKQKAQEIGLIMASPTDVEAIRSAGYLKEIDGGLWFNTSLGVPPCTDTMRGVMWFVASNDRFDDQLLVCARDAKGNTAWHFVQL